jgi:exosome complex component CSL4
MVRVDAVLGGFSLAVPEVGSVVTCKVTAITGRFAKVDILCIGSKPFKDNFHGMIRSRCLLCVPVLANSYPKGEGRQYDVRETERDKVVMPESFRPGDIVRARIISLGDARSYVLTTAAIDLGVVHATSEAGWLQITL